MTEYYQPTLLFRQNAIRRSPFSSPTSSETNLSLPDYKVKNSSWVINPDVSKDTGILNKICSLNRMNIKSNYWKIPDSNMNLTSMAVQNSGDLARVSISSGNDDSNLFIYELDLNDNYLTHHNTISLPNIHSMKWVPESPSLLMTGTNKGYGHLISVPDYDKPDESAEIIKRFNHRKHLRSINKDPSIYSHNSTVIDKMSFIDSEKLMSIYDDNLFNWDLNDSTSSAKPKPTSITSINGLMNFDNSKTNPNILSICGKFGVSIFDLRDPKFSIPSSLIKECNKKKLGANLIKWSSTDENVFAASHLDGVIRLWDVRRQDNFGNLRGHSGRVINSIEWVDGDLFSGGKDGNIIHWDLTKDIYDKEYDLFDCTLKEGLDSIKFNPLKNSEDRVVNQRQCGTKLPASNTSITSLQSIETCDDLKVLSIDGSSFFGLHSRIYDVVDVEYSGKRYYSSEDIDLILKSQQTSDSTLVDEKVEVTQPLSIKRVPTTVLVKSEQSIEIIDDPIFSINNNNSNDTLLDDPIESSSLQLDFDKLDFDTLDFNDVETSSSVYSSVAATNYSTNYSAEDSGNESTLSEESELDSPTSFSSTVSHDSIETVATEVEELTFKPGHKYQISDLKFDDFIFDANLMFQNVLTTCV